MCFYMLQTQISMHSLELTTVTLSSVKNLMQEVYLYSTCQQQGNSKCLMWWGVAWHFAFRSLASIVWKKAIDLSSVFHNADYKRNIFTSWETRSNCPKSCPIVMDFGFNVLKMTFSSPSCPFSFIRVRVSAKTCNTFVFPAKGSPTSINL